MGSHDEAVNAIDHLDSKFVWEGMESAMVVKWMDAALQRRRREQHLAAMRQGLVPNMTMGECVCTGVCTLVPFDVNVCLCLSYARQACVVFKPLPLVQEVCFSCGNNAHFAQCP